MLLVDRMREMGFDSPELPRSLLLGGRWAALPEDEQRRRVDLALSRVVDESALRTFPIQAARSFRVEDIPPLWVAARSAPDLGEAVERIVRYAQLWGRVASFAIEWDPGREVLRVAVPLAGGSDLGAQCRRELVLASFLEGMRGLTRTRVAPRCVHFGHPAPRGSHDFDEFFGVPVRFGSWGDFMEFDRDLLALPLASADAAVSEIVVEHLESWKGRLSRTSVGLEERVRRAVLEHLDAGVPRMAEVARSIGTTERTLRRQLRRRGSGFGEIVSRARIEKARKLLSTTPRTITDIALSTGFADSSAFARAFRRSSGETPSTHRGRAAARPPVPRDVEP